MDGAVDAKCTIRNGYPILVGAEKVPEDFPEPQAGAFRSEAS